MYGEYDAWSITVYDANFMLSQYNGRGNTNNITITQFPNMGDGLYGYVQFSINNNPCFSGSLSNIDGKDDKEFSVYPKYVTLNGKDDTAFITVNSSCSYTKTENSNEFSTIDGTNGFTIKSDSNISFENQEIKVTNCDGLTEIVYVSQNPSQDTNNNMLSVNPQYITLNDENKTFSINVISICNGSNTYSHSELNGVNLVQNGNMINGTITSDDFTSGTFTVSNDCDTKEVNITYNKTSDSECSILIDDKQEVNYTFTADTTVSYTVTSSSNWGVYSYDSTKVRCSKSGDKLTISLGEDKAETNNKEIILRNREGCEARVIYSVGSGLVSESGITFTFGDNTYTFTTALTQNSSSEDISFNICVFAYDNNDNAIEWKVKSSAFSATTTDLKGGTSDGCKTVTLKATDATKKSKSTSYTIKLQEQETYKEITVKVTITRPQDEVTSSYSIEISPESGIYSKSEMKGFQISVTPTYVYNGNTYYIGNNDAMMNDINPSYQGVSARTESKTYGVDLKLTNGDDVYDTLVYDVNITEEVLENLDSFEICTTATTEDDTVQETVTECTTISLTASTVEVTCDFTTGSTLIEVGGEAQTIEEVFYSQIDGEKVEIITSCTYGDCSFIESINLDGYGEKLYIKVSENDSYDERNAQITITQDGGQCEGEYVISIKQYGNKTIFIPDFDYLVIRYFWGSSAGVDLDTVTVMPYLIKENGSIVEDTTKYDYLSKGVGYGHTYSVSGVSGVYIEHAGDNTGDGNECVYLNFKNLCSESQLQDMLDNGIEKIRVDLYGIWYNTKGNGEIDVSLIAYKDGDIIDDPYDQFNFINTGGTEVYNDIKDTKVCVQGSSKASTYKTDYNLIGYVEYNIKTASAMLTLNAECEESSYILTNAMSSTSLTISHEASTSNYIEFITMKEQTFFDNVTVTSSKSWISNLITSSVSNPMRFYYTVTEFASEEETERSCKITVVQGESNKVIEYQIIQKSECECSLQETVNATATLSVKTQANGEKLYENNGSYYVDVICNVVLDKTIICGSATARIEYGLGSIDNAAFSEVIIPNGSSSGTSTSAYTCGIVSEYDDNKPMDCISSARTSHNLIFTNNNCYVKGIITATVDQSSLCQPCDCDVTIVSVTPNNYKFTYDGEEKIFTLKVETDTCDSCTKGYKLYDPNGSLVTAGTGENTVIIKYENAVIGNYVLKADDDTSKTATLNIDKAEPSYQLSVTGSPILEPAAVEAYIQVMSLKNNQPYSAIMFSESCTWVTGYYLQSSSNGVYTYQFTTTPNTTTSQRTCTVTVQQEGGLTGVTFDIVQKGEEIVITNNCATVSVEGRKWIITLPYAAASDVTYTFNAVNGYSDGEDWVQTMTVLKGATTATATTSQFQFATDDSTFSSVSPMEDDTYVYSDCDIYVESDYTKPDVTCDCEQASITCDPTYAYLDYNSGSTVSTNISASLPSTNCNSQWVAIDDSGSFVASGLTNGTITRSITGTVTVHLSECQEKTAKFNVYYSRVDLITEIDTTRQCPPPVNVEVIFSQYSKNGTHIADYTNSTSVSLNPEDKFNVIVKLTGTTADSGCNSRAVKIEIRSGQTLQYETLYDRIEINEEIINTSATSINPFYGGGITVYIYTP